MKEESTHFIFDGQKVLISPDITPVVHFLMDIEKEVQSILGFNKKLDDIRKSYLEMLEFVSFLSGKLKENNLDFKFTFREHPEKIAEKLEFYFPLRSQMIVLFASLEVLFTLHLAYENKTKDKEELLKLATTDNIKKFLNDFLLTDNNDFYKTNKERLSKVDSTKLRDLRNSLTHFFSVSAGGLSLSPSLLEEKSRKFEKILKQNKKGNIVFISENDLFELIKYANLIRFKKWSDDFAENKAEFKEKMKFVIDLVKDKGAVILENKNLKI